MGPLVSHDVLSGHFFESHSQPTTTSSAKFFVQASCFSTTCSTVVSITSQITTRQSYKSAGQSFTTKSTVPHAMGCWVVEEACHMLGGAQPQATVSRADAKLRHVFQHERDSRVGGAGGHSIKLKDKVDSSFP